MASPLTRALLRFIALSLLGGCLACGTASSEIAIVPEAMDRAAPRGPESPPTDTSDPQTSSPPRDRSDTPAPAKAAGPAPVVGVDFPNPPAGTQVGGLWGHGEDPGRRQQR